MDGHVARMEEEENAYVFFVGNMKGRYDMEYRDSYGRIILKWNLNEWARWVWTGLIWPRMRINGDLM